MSEQLTVVVISSSVALVVAAMGFFASVRAQIVATKRGFQNSLALFERQTADQARTRFADTKRSTYSTLMRLADDLLAAREAEARARKDLEQAQRAFDQSGVLGVEVDKRSAVVEAARVVAEERSALLDQAVGEVELLGVDAVRDAAGWLRYAAATTSDGYSAARAGFVTHARAELGIATEAGPVGRPGA